MAIRICLMTLLVGAVTLLPVEASADETARSTTCGTFIAHRGEHSRWTENSLGAVEAAAEVGADYVEVDVRETEDAALVLMHDRTIDRTTRGSGKVADKTLAQLREVRLNDGSRLPSLSRALAVIEEASIEVMLELKAVRSDRAFASLATRIRALGVDRVVVTSFKPRLLDAIHEVVPEARRSLVTAEAPTLAQGVEYGSVSPQFRSITKSWLEDMRDAGYPVYAWTLNSKKAWSRWNGRVGAITTDDAIQFAKWRTTASCPQVPAD